MRVVILTVQVPFVWGGAEAHAQELRRSLEEMGHRAALLAIPFKWYPPERILDHMLACRLLDLQETEGQRIDVMIGLKFPAYLAPHPNKVLWILHQHRTAYDRWNDPILGDLIHYPNGLLVRDAIIQADRTLIPEARAVFANSRNVAARLKMFCGIDAEPLYHPPPGAAQFYSRSPESYLLFPSRVIPNKRQSLVIEALPKTRQPVRVKFAGLPNHPDYLAQLQKVAAKLRVDDRVEWLGHVSEEQKRDLYAHSLGVIYPPIDEDYGYVTLEAMLSAKPVIVTSDCGGPLEFVEHGITGLVAEPSAESLADAMDRLWDDRAAATNYGNAGLERYRVAEINWPKVIERLLAGARVR